MASPRSFGVSALRALWTLGTGAARIVCCTAGESKFYAASVVEGRDAAAATRAIVVDPARSGCAARVVRLVVHHCADAGVAFTTVGIGRARVTAGAEGVTRIGVRRRVAARAVGMFHAVGIGMAKRIR